ncbi:MAG: PP2C family protein-serine/threonine phosphatase [Candidatus Dependentiae bacterium]|jgi:serine/threonine protein phosphatase PrpC
MYFSQKAHTVPVLFGCLLVVSSLHSVTVGVWQDANRNNSHPTMQDAYVAIECPDGRHLWGVYDGHGYHNLPTRDGGTIDTGKYCANLVADDMAFCVPRFGWDAARIAQRYVELDDQLATVPHQAGVQGGTTATTVLFDGVDMIDIIHAGDCRVLLGEREVTHQITTDHNLQVADEVARIIHAHGWTGPLPKKSSLSHLRMIAQINGWTTSARLLCDGTPDLNVTRTIGDRRHENSAVATPVPDIIKLRLEPHDTFLVVVSDGVTEVLSNNKIAYIVRNVLAADTIPSSVKNRAQVAAKTIVGVARCGLPDEGIVRSHDNLTALVVLLNNEAVKPRSGSCGTASSVSTGATTPAATDSSPDRSPVAMVRVVGDGFAATE